MMLRTLLPQIAEFQKKSYFLSTSKEECIGILAIRNSRSYKRHPVRNYGRFIFLRKQKLIHHVESRMAVIKTIASTPSKAALEVILPMADTLKSFDKENANAMPTVFSWVLPVRSGLSFEQNVSVRKRKRLRKMMVRDYNHLTCPCTFPRPIGQ